MASAFAIPFASAAAMQNDNSEPEYSKEDEPLVASINKSLQFALLDFQKAQPENTKNAYSKPRRDWDVCIDLTYLTTYNYLAYINYYLELVQGERIPSYY